MQELVEPGGSTFPSGVTGLNCPYRPREARKGTPPSGDLLRVQKLKGGGKETASKTSSLAKNLAQRANEE